ncbi:MAG: hypothetical protein IJN21_10395 [Clostridia bacterium]|nr:hypothetical protein [Clostridia bacterium]
MDYKRQYTLSWPAAAALAVALTLAAYLIARLFSSGGNAPLSSVVRLNVPANREVQVSGEYVYYQESGSLHCVDSRGKYVWNMAVEMDSDFYASPHGVAAWHGKTLSIINKDTGVLMGSRQLEEEIISASVGDAYVAAVLAPEHDSTVKLLDLNGADVDHLTGFTGLTIMDYDFFEGRDLFWLMTMDTGGSMPTCKISTYKPGKRETGVIEDMEQVLYQVMFRSSQIAVVGTNYLCMYDYHGKEIEDDRVTVYGYYLHAVDKSGDNPLMLFVPNRQAEGASGITDVRMIRGRSESIIHLPVECTHLEANGTTLYGFSGRSLVKNEFGEKTSKMYTFPVEVETVLGITSDKTAVVTSGGLIFLIRLP